MYKHLLRFSIFIIILLILLSTYILIKLNYQNNTLIINPSEYPQVLDEIHSNIDKYIGKKISVSGYVYIQDDFLPNNFVIAQDVIIDSEDFIIGFLCENLTDIPLKPFDYISITGKIGKCIYNNLQYPIIKVSHIT